LRVRVSFSGFRGFSWPVKIQVKDDNRRRAPRPWPIFQASLPARFPLVVLTRIIDLPELSRDPGKDISPSQEDLRSRSRAAETSRRQHVCKAAQA
jgi:hypothetical protein